MFIPIIFINVTDPQDSLRLLTEFTQNYKNIQRKFSKLQIKSSYHLLIIVISMQRLDINIY